MKLFDKDALGRKIFGDKYGNRRAKNRRKASKKERVLFYSRVFSGEAKDRRVNLFDRREPM